MKINAILIIDDDEMALYCTKDLLVKNNYSAKIYTETSGRSALHFLSNTTEIPALILLDYFMVESTGLDFIEDFDKLPAHITANCKIVLLSGAVDCFEEEMIKIQNSEHTLGVLNKPLVMAELKDLVIKSLSH